MVLLTFMEPPLFVGFKLWSVVVLGVLLLCPEQFPVSVVSLPTLLFSERLVVCYVTAVPPLAVTIID
jgi:hypothetical protein